MLLQQPALGTLYVEDEFMFFSFFAIYIYLKSRPGLESRPGQQQNGKGLTETRGKAKSFQGAFRLCLNKKNVSDMELDMVADMEVDKVADMLGHGGQHGGKQGARQ